eukprot:gene20248-24823_t
MLRLSAALIHEHFNRRFHAAEHIIDGLAAKADKFGADDAGDEIGGDIEDLLRCGAIEAFAKDGGHGLGEGLYFRAEFNGE